MKGNKNKWLYVIVILAVLATVIVAVFKVNSYLSKVILSQPFRKSIDGISPESAKAIKTFGFSPTGKIQILKNIYNFNTWEYFEYSIFKSLYIFMPESVDVFDKAILKTMEVYNVVKITPIKFDKENNWPKDYKPKDLLLVLLLTPLFSAKNVTQYLTSSIYQYIEMSKATLYRFKNNEHIS